MNQSQPVERQFGKSVKIIDKINAIMAAEAEAEANGNAPEKKNTYYSYEYFPPKTAAGKFTVFHHIF